MAFTKSHLVVLCAILLCFASCHVFKGKVQKSPDVVSELSSKEDANNSDKIYRASATKYWELAHTAIDIHFNLPERTADGIADLSMHPYYYDMDSVVLNAKSMKIKQVLDGNNKPLTFTYDSLKLCIRLPKTYTKSDTLLLKISYVSMPYLNKNVGSAAIKEDRGLYFINTNHDEPYLPVQIWTQGETESNSHWFPTFDNPIFKSTFTITMHVPDSFKTLSNGSLEKSVKEDNHLRADTWNQKLPISTYLAMMAAGDYAISKENWRGKEVSYYVPVKYAAYGKEIFSRTPEMMEFFSQKLGVDYPWNKYSQIIGYQYVSGAMENVSASLFGAFNLKDTRQLTDDNNDFIVAHELFHQWFGDYVTAESWSNLTLNESFADYSEHLWTEYKYGEEARANYWLYGMTRYLGQAKSDDPPLLRFYYESQEDMFDRISYSKGGLTLHYLRSLMGDKAFFDGLHLYLTQNAFGNAEVPQLRMAFEKVTGKDWNWFFNQWYYKGGHPKLKVNYNYDDANGKLKVVICQIQADSIGLYELPMKNLVITGGTSEEISWTVAKAKDTFEIAYKKGERPVVVPDVAHWVVGEWTDMKAPWQWYAQYQYATDFLSRRAALLGLANSKNSDTCKMVYGMALKDKSPLLRAVAIGLYDYDKNPKIAPEWRAQLGKLAAGDPDNKVRTKALNALGDLQDETFINAYETAINDSSYKVAAAGLSALDNVNHKRAVNFARELHPENSNGNVLLYQAAKVIGTDGEAEDLNFFMDKTLHLFENERKFFLTAFQNYLVHAKEKTSYVSGVDFIKVRALKYADSYDGFYYGGLILNLEKYALSQSKIATDKEQIEKWKDRMAIAHTAFVEYKNAVTDEDIKESVAQLEKAD